MTGDMTNANKLTDSNRETLSIAYSRAYSGIQFTGRGQAGQWQKSGDTAIVPWTKLLPCERAWFAK